MKPGSRGGFTTSGLRWLMEFLLSAPFGFISGDVDVNTNTCSGGLEGDPWNLEFNPLQTLEEI